MRPARHRWYVLIISVVSNRTGHVPSGSPTAREGRWEAGPGDKLFLAMQAVMGSLPIVAEDLGVITPEVVRLRENHGLPGMVVLQFEVGNPEFDFSSVSENSVCYTGTHDNDTTLGWFLSNGADTRTPEEIQATTGQHTATDRRVCVCVWYRRDRDKGHDPCGAVEQLPHGSRANAGLPGFRLKRPFEHTGRFPQNNWCWRALTGQLNADLTVSVHKLVRESNRSSRAQ